MAVLNVGVWPSREALLLKPNDRFVVHDIVLGQEAAYDYMFVHATMPSGQKASLHVLYQEDVYNLARNGNVSVKVLSVSAKTGETLPLTIQLESPKSE